MALGDILSGVGQLDTTTLIGIGAAIIIMMFVFVGIRNRQRAKSPGRLVAPKPGFFAGKSVLELMIIAIIVLTLVQVIGFIIPQLINTFGGDATPIKLGPMFLVLTIAAGTALIYKIILTPEKKWEANDWILIGIVVVLVIAFVVLLPRVVPEIFSVAADTLKDGVTTQMQSLLGNIVGQ